MRTFVLAAALLLASPLHGTTADAVASQTDTVATIVDDTIFRSAFELYTLTLTNYLTWCSVTVDSDPASSAAIISKDYPEGSLSLLHADPNVPFVWGYWIGTDADTSGTGDTSQDAVVTMSADRAVLACCPFAGSTCST